TGIGPLQSLFRTRCRMDLDCKFTGHLFGKSTTMNVAGTEDFYLRQSSDGGSRLELRLCMDTTAKNCNPAGVVPRQVLRAEPACGSGPEFVDRTILKQYERFAGFCAIEDNRFVV